MTTLTPVDWFDGWCVKREDLADFVSPEFPSGAKVRQFNRMADALPRRPMVVGCAPNSAIQIYLSAAAHLKGVPAHVFVAARKERTEATAYAASMGAEIHEERPGYISVCQARARKVAQDLAPCVRWDFDGAVKDSAQQAANIPVGVKRVLVPTGSGLICAGVLAGLAGIHDPPEVVGIQVSPKASIQKILEAAKKHAHGLRLPSLTSVLLDTPYNKWVAAKLPDDTPLDPFYAAKALPFVREGDCLWNPGLRPLAAMPKGCRVALEKGTFNTLSPMTELQPMVAKET